MSDRILLSTSAQLVRLVCKTGLHCVRQWQQTTLALESPRRQAFYQHTLILTTHELETPVDRASPFVNSTSKPLLFQVTHVFLHLSIAPVKAKPKSSCNLRLSPSLLLTPSMLSTGPHWLSFYLNSLRGNNSRSYENVLPRCFTVGDIQGHELNRVTN